MNQKRTKTRSNGERTRLKLLNAAEQEFGERGFDAVSLRDITVAAEVTLALASYHFGTKENLFEEVVARRARILCATREKNLEALSDPDPRTLLDAFLSPLFAKARSGEPGWRAYFSVIARLGESNRWLPLLHRHFDPTARLFVDALHKAMPKADPDDLSRAFTMTLQVMLATVSRHGRVDKLTDGQVRADDLAQAYEVLLTYTTAGLESLNP